MNEIKIYVEKMVNNQRRNRTMKKILFSITVALFTLLLLSGQCFAVHLTTDEDVGVATTWMYHVTLNGTVYDSPAAAGVIDPELIRLWLLVDGLVTIGSANTATVTISDEYGSVSLPSEAYTFTPRKPVVPVNPEIKPVNGKRTVVTTATEKDTDNVNGELSYVITFGSKTKTALPVVAGTTQRCEIDITDLLVEGTNNGTLIAKNPWGESAAVPLSVNVITPKTPSGLRFSVD